ncbi:HlyD family secretion protein [Neptunicella marina]|uniref:HlyD family efflux transporter periplasmic adaptor subunit n=1 Tax=Neptunicella marina TaxID=2125989 RepID=A0A8J6M587_9ALTE|nr:HlyD family efflux transporter periplasmic adaptor subunit [Neptunicella marina]MBC3766371.1 HlyD family efflux transporter periplasmic adaptor subunit [Neptunicella marina]
MKFEDIQKQVANKRKNRMVILFTSALVILTIFIAMGLMLAQKKISKNELQLSHVELGDFTEIIVANGQFKNRYPSVIPTTQEGVVQTILVDEGQYVTRGTPLLTLSNDNFDLKKSQLQNQRHNSQLELELKNARLALETVQQQTEVARLKGEYDVLQAQFRAQQELANKGIISKLELMATEVKLRNMQRQHTLAANTLSTMNSLHNKEETLWQLKVAEIDKEIDALNDDINELNIVAKEDGQIQKINAKLGERLTLGAPVIELSKNEDLYFVAQIPERDAQRIQPQNQANIRVNSKWLQGQVERVSPNVTNGFVDVYIQFSLNNTSQYQLKQDLSAKVEITTQVLDNTTFSDKRIANNANTEQSSWFYNQADNSLVKRNIKLGEISQQKVMIVSGAQPGELIVSFEQSKLWGDTPPKVVL